jgi:NAD(P)-dependent dehydrogenase (short-subunit alcohol dehydrogenase family)
VAIVTGASKGIGRAIARAFAADGTCVVVSSRDQDRCQLVANEIHNDGGTAIAVSAHMGRPETVDALFLATVEAFGGVDVLVNNAATNPIYSPLFDTPDELVAKIFAVNVLGPLQLGRLAARHMAEHGGGAILNIVSKSAFAPEANLGPYAASKAALVALTKVMAQEWAAFGVRVNAIAPGPFATTMVSELFAQDEYREALLRSTAQRRIADPDEIVGAARFLTGTDAGFVTGAVLHVDGGRLP